MRACCGVGFVLFGLALPAQAQNCIGRPDFDRCMQSFTAGNQARLAQSQQRLFEQYVQSNGPWLQQNYAAHRAQGGQMSFQQFAYWGLMTANGSNIAGAAQAQRDAFEGGQRADRIIQQGNDSYNRGAAENSARTGRAVEGWTNGAIRGVAPYVDPRSGQVVQLPYARLPGTPFQSGGQTYIQDQAGTYRQWTGNGWVTMTPGR